jgi:hypothetical protein
MKQESRVRQMPKARGIISHGIDGAREVVNGRIVAIMSLMEGM